MRRILAFCFILLVYSHNTLAAPASDYWEFWDKSNEKSAQSINHAVWQDLLKTYLYDQPDGQFRLFRYGEVSVKDRDKLQNYISTLSAIDPRSYRKVEQEAYWINLYNVLTINLILQHYPVKSITKIGPWYKFGPWDQGIITVADKKLTLNDIEHRILRPIWNDNRIHYALNCASKGCPDLSEQAFTAENTEKQLDELARRFIAQDKGVHFYKGQLVLSKIYEWYAVDFGDKQGLLSHIVRYIEPGKSLSISGYTGPIDYQYDWDLNVYK